MFRFALHRSARESKPCDPPAPQPGRLIKLSCRKKPNKFTQTLTAAKLTHVLRRNENPIRRKGIHNWENVQERQTSDATPDTEIRQMDWMEEKPT